MEGADFVQAGFNVYDGSRPSTVITANGKEVLLFECRKAKTHRFRVKPIRTNQQFV
jgi:hypothetical protein